MSTETHKRAQKKYDQSDKHKATRKRYRQTEKYKIAKKLHYQSDKGKAERKCYRQSEKYKITTKLYHQSGKYKAHKLMYVYKLSIEDYNELFNQQEGKCRICSKEFNIKDPHDVCIDHSHATGKVRGILCRKCNLGLGAFDDDIGKLLCVIKYLEESE